MTALDSTPGDAGLGESLGVICGDVDSICAAVEVADCTSGIGWSGGEAVVGGLGEGSSAASSVACLTLSGMDSSRSSAVRTYRGESQDIPRVVFAPAVLFGEEQR